MRQDVHFSEFQLVQRDSQSVFLHIDQFRELGHRLGLDKALVENAAQEVEANHNASNVKPPTVAKSGATSVESTNTNEIIDLDFYTVHGMLLELSELHLHNLHKRELEIKAKTNISEEMFWQHDGELFRIYDHFQMHDLDRQDYLGFPEVRHLLHHLGFQPFRPRENEVLDRLMKESDADGSETFTFEEFLNLISRVRTHQKAIREARLRREFGRYSKLEETGSRSWGDKESEALTKPATVAAALNNKQAGELCLEAEWLSGLLTSVGLAGRTSHERELVDLAVHNYCDETITFSEFEELCQLICESLARDEVQEQYADAEAFGVTSFRLHRYQAAFDSVRTNDLPCIKVLDLPKALLRLLSRPPEMGEVMEMLESISPTKGSRDVSFVTFLHLLSCFSSGQAVLVKGPAFDLRSVNDRKLREILHLFPLASEYIDEVAAAELPELVAGFFGVLPTTDLRELQPPVNNIRQLVQWAQKKAASRVDAKSTETIVQQIEHAVKHNHI
jgi:Ca2+-binding EF-hand superfamily protein